MLSQTLRFDEILYVVNNYIGRYIWVRIKEFQVGKNTSDILLQTYKIHQFHSHLWKEAIVILLLVLWIYCCSCHFNLIKHDDKAFHATATVKTSFHNIIKLNAMSCCGRNEVNLEISSFQFAMTYLHRKSLYDV